MQRINGIRFIDLEELSISDWLDTFYDLINNRQVVTRSESLGDILAIISEIEDKRHSRIIKFEYEYILVSHKTIRDE